VEIDIPPIIPSDLFEAVQARLAQNNPKVAPPRVVNGPTLLTGLAVCAACGSGMTRTGTRRRHRSYSYYSCAGCQQKGRSVCQGRHIPMTKLDTLIIENVKDQLFGPERLKVILEALVERQSAKDRAVHGRRAALELELSSKEEKLGRLYHAIEDGIVELDAQLRDRIATLKTERDIVRASLDRITTQLRSHAAITPDRLEAFSALIRGKLESGDTQARKAYLRSVISYIEVDDHKIRIVGDKATLAAVVAGRQAQSDNVRGFVRKWRARRDSNS
jgi:site-specific DNA recombinase